jgi:hypothetical protein
MMKWSERSFVDTRQAVARIGTRHGIDTRLGGAEANDQYVKVARLLGEMDWPRHAEEDELFRVRRPARSRSISLE